MVSVPAGAEGDEAELVSPSVNLQQKTNLCLSFWFLMIENESGELRVNMRYSNNTIRTLWVVFGVHATEVGLTVVYEYITTCCF